MVSKVVMTGLLCIVVTVSISYAENQPEIDSIIEEVLILSGLKQQIEQIPGHLKSQKLPPQLSQQQHNTIARILSESFQPQFLNEEIKEYLRQGFTDERAWQLLVWLRSPLSRKMSQLEVHATAAESIPDIERFAARLQSSLPEAQRLALVERLDAAGKLSETGTDMVIELLRIMTQLSNEMTSPGRRPPAASFDQKLNALRSQLLVVVRQKTQLTYLFAYRSVADAELNEYVSFFESSLGKWYVKTFNDSILHALRAGTEKAAQEIHKIRPPTNEPKETT